MSETRPYVRAHNRVPDFERERIMAFAAGAACKGAETLYTADSRQITKSALRAMQQTCAQCPVLALCAEFAEQINPTCGVWAGKLYTLPKWPRST